MTQALQNVPDAGVPDGGLVCVRPGQNVNPDGGRTPLPLTPPIFPPSLPTVR